jgi:putative endonuclease
LNTGRRRRAWHFGRFAESLCAWHLRLRGYRVVARGFRTTVGEIDIVARRGGVLAVVEVKGRGDLTAAAESVGRRQRRRIARATQALVKARPGLAELDLRFDVMLVRPWRPPRHLRGAWRADD